MTEKYPNAFIIKKEEIEHILSSTAPIRGKHILEPLKTLALEQDLPFKILEDHEAVNEAEIHRTVGDLWYCLQGEVTFIYGGELMEPKIKVRRDGTTDENELLAEEISGGANVILKPGDWLWIPAGVAHQHSCVGTARLMIIKIPKTDDPHME